MNTTWEDALGHQGIGWGYSSSRLWYAGEEIWFTLGEPSEDEPQKIYLLIRDTEESLLEVVAEAEFPGTVSYTFESHRVIDEVHVFVDWLRLGPKATLLDVGCASTGEPKPFPINLGVNDAWYVPNMAGHGVLVTVYPSIEKVFLALFTFDTTRPEDTATGILGDPAQRWLTAFGTYSVNSAQLAIDLTVGGVFLESDPRPEWLPGGEMKLQLDHCNHITLDYDIPSINRAGVLELERVAPDRIELCEQLSVTSEEYAIESIALTLFLRIGALTHFRNFVPGTHRNS
jgi:hypothetical protein